jgi:anti-sigma factor (TIGR02949 family)
MNEPGVIDCEEALRRLAEYLDAELREEGRNEMEQHLARCRSCFSRVEFEKRLKAETAALGREPASAELERRIRELVETFKG